MEWELGTHPNATGIDEIINTLIIEDASELYGEVYVHVQLLDNLDLEGRILRIHGNLETYGGININGGTLIVDGNFDQAYYGLELNGGTLIVKGNYSCFKLNMSNKNDKVNVYGDFKVKSSFSNYKSELSEGVLEVKGDFILEGYNTYFKSSGTHKIVLSGNDIQTVKLGSPHFDVTQFNILDISNDTGVKFEDYCIINKELTGNVESIIEKDKLQFTLEAYEKLQDWNDDLYLPTRGKWQLTHDMILPNVNFNLPRSSLDLNGNSLVINGNTYQYGDIYLNGGYLEINGDLQIPFGKLDLNKGELIVNGNLELLYIDDLIDLNGGTIIINGNLIQRSGTVDINGGTLIVNGDYVLLDFNRNEDNTIYISDNRSILKMVNDLDKVIVNGNFLTRSTESHSNYLTAGTMEIKGDFTQEKSFDKYSYWHNNFYSSNTHKVILSGNSLQRVRFDSPGIQSSMSRFNILEINNSSEEGVVFESKVGIDDVLINTTKNLKGIKNICFSLKALEKLQKWDDVLIYNQRCGKWKLTQDIILPDSEMYIEYATLLDLNGHSLTLGNLILNTDAEVNLNGGTLTVVNNLIQGDGTVNINSGTLIIKGDYRLQKEKIVNGVKDYSKCDGLLVMTNQDDYLIVEGNFVMHSVRDHSNYLTAGIIDLKGDFIGGNEMSGTHKVILSGTGLQKITDDGLWGTPNFNILEITNSSEEGVIFETIVKINTLFEHHQNNYLINQSRWNEFPDYDNDGLSDNIDPAPQNPKIVELDFNEYSLLVGEKHNTIVTVKNLDGSTIDVTTLASYQSSDENIITVDNQGVVEAINEGSATITVIYENQRVKANVTVFLETPLYFSDDFLEQIIREKIHKPTGYIYKSDLEGITELIANGKSIRNLFGIQNLINLQELVLSNNNIEDITLLYNLINLQSLNLKNNQINDISPLSQLINLKYLYLSGNQILDYSPVVSYYGNLIDKDFEIVIYEGDFNNNGIIDLTDLTILSQAYGTKSSDDSFDDTKDLNNDGIVDIYDLVILAKKIK